GFEGRDCATRACPAACSGRGTCHEGSCICQDGYEGADCSIRLSKAALPCVVACTSKCVAACQEFLSLTRQAQCYNDCSDRCSATCMSAQARLLAATGGSSSSSSSSSTHAGTGATGAGAATGGVGAATGGAAHEADSATW
ncbi:MAG: hypothetical protein ACK41Y_16670, partial [Paracoccus hibiscisoli]|uniref:hypothetical protein n=1 Tax=Paracoccus hibiscisoli TaxID=2023261 RepID=UPI00391C4E5E